MKKFAMRIFTFAEIEAWALPYCHDGATVLSDVIVEHDRWSVWHELIFQAPDDEKLWKIVYQVPATEKQDCERWPDLEAIQVEPYKVEITRYREVYADGDTH